MEEQRSPPPVGRSLLDSPPLDLSHTAASIVSSNVSSNANTSHSSSSSQKTSRLASQSNQYPTDGRELIKRGRLFGNSKNGAPSVWTSASNAESMYCNSIGTSSNESRDSSCQTSSSHAIGPTANQCKSTHSNVPSALGFDQPKAYTSSHYYGNNNKRIDWTASFSPNEDDDDLPLSDEKWSSQSRIRMAGGREIYSASRLQWSKKRTHLESKRSAERGNLRNVAIQTADACIDSNDLKPLALTTADKSTVSHSTSITEHDLLRLESEPSDGERIDSMLDCSKNESARFVPNESMNGKYSEVFDVLNEFNSNFTPSHSDHETRRSSVLTNDQPPLADLLGIESNSIEIIGNNSNLATVERDLSMNVNPNNQININNNNNNNVMRLNEAQASRRNSKDEEERDDGIESDVENMEGVSSTKRTSSDSGCSDRPETSLHLLRQLNHQAKVAQQPPSSVSSSSSSSQHASQSLSQQVMHSSNCKHQRQINRNQIKPKAPGYPQRVLQATESDLVRKHSYSSPAPAKTELFRNQNLIETESTTSEDPADDADEENEADEDADDEEEDEPFDSNDIEHARSEASSKEADSSKLLKDLYLPSHSEMDRLGEESQVEDVRKSEARDAARLAEISCDELVKSMLYIPNESSTRNSTTCDFKPDSNYDDHNNSSNTLIETESLPSSSVMQPSYQRIVRKGSKSKIQQHHLQSIDGSNPLDETITLNNPSELSNALLSNVSASQRLFMLTESNDSVSKFKSNAIIDSNLIDSNDQTVHTNRTTFDHSQLSSAGAHLLGSVHLDEPTDYSNGKSNKSSEDVEILVRENDLPLNMCIDTLNDLSSNLNGSAGLTLNGNNGDSFVAHVDQMRLLHERVQQHVMRETLIDQRPPKSSDNLPGASSSSIVDRSSNSMAGMSLDQSMRRLSLSSELNANAIASDCESNELPSELSVESSVETMSRLASMPVLEDGLSSADSDSDSSDCSDDRRPSISNEIVSNKGIKRCTSMIQPTKGSSAFQSHCQDRAIQSMDFDAIEPLSQSQHRDLNNGLVGQMSQSPQQQQQQQQQMELFAKCRPRNKKLASSRSCDNNDISSDKEIKFNRDTEHDCAQSQLLLVDSSSSSNNIGSATRSSRSSNSLNNGSLGNGTNSYAGPPTSGCPSNTRSHTYFESCTPNGHLPSSEPIWSSRNQHPYDPSMGTGNGNTEPAGASNVLVKVASNENTLEERPKGAEKHLDEDCDTDQETDRLLGAQRNDERAYYEEKQNPPIKKKSNSREVLIEGVLFRARYLGSTQLICEGQPTKATRMMQAEEAVSRIKAPEGETQPSTEVDLFISTEKIMVLNTDLKEIMMDHTLRTISYIADIGDLLVLMARRRQPLLSGSSGVGNACSANSNANDLSAQSAEAKYKRSIPKMICHVFESEEAQFIAQSIGQAFQVAYMEFLKANGIDDSSFVKELDYQEVLNSQEIFGNELEMFARKEKQKEVVVPKQKGEILGMVIVESGWGSMLPTVVIANMSQQSPAARCGQLNIGDQIIAINGISLVGLPLGTCQRYIKNTKNQTVVKLTVVPCAPVVEVRIRRPDTKYQLGFSVQNGVICSLLRGGIAERGGVRVGHRIIEINGQSVVAVPHERIVNLLATSVGEIHMKTMPTSMFRLLTGQESPMFI